MLFIVLLLGAAGGETAASIFTKLDYDKSYFESVVRLKERGQSDSRFSPSEWEKEVGRATANLPVLQTLYAERAAYEQGQPFSLPKTTAGFRVYSNLVCMLNLLQAQARGSDDDVIRYGSRVVIDARENLGKVVGEKPEYYLSLYRQLFFAMAAAYYHLGKDDDALKWFARIRGDADIQKLQKELGAHAQEKRDPKAERLEAMRQKPIVVMPFETSDADKWRGRGLMELVTADLVQKTPLLVVERAQLDKVLKEMELAQAGATREKSAAKIGELLAAGTVLTGSIAGSTLTVSLVGTGDGVTLAQRTANVGTDNFFGPARGVVLRRHGIDRRQRAHRSHRPAGARRGQRGDARTVLDRRRADPQRPRHGSQRHPRRRRSWPAIDRLQRAERQRRRRVERRQPRHRQRADLARDQRV